MYATSFADEALDRGASQNTARPEPDRRLTSGALGPPQTESRNPWLSDATGLRHIWPSDGSLAESGTAPATVRVTWLPGYGTLVELRGDEDGCLDERGLETATRVLQEIMGDPAGREVAIDLSLVTFISAAFLNVLYRFWRQLGCRQGSVSLWGVCCQCAELLHFGGLDELIDCHAVPHPARRVNGSQIAAARAGR